MSGFQQMRKNLLKDDLPNVYNDGRVKNVVAKDTEQINEGFLNKHQYVYPRRVYKANSYSYIRPSMRSSSHFLMFLSICIYILYSTCGLGSESEGVFLNF